MIVTIDGPAGAGKSSAAKMLAGRLGFEFLDTGAMYRAVTLAGLRAQLDLTLHDAVARLLDTIRLDLPPGRVLLNDEDVSIAIRTADVTAASGAVASNPMVRRKLVEWQRRIAAGRNMVCEGRDQGTIVFPAAECKFFLIADPLERARRRHRELTERGETITLDEILNAQQERDARDAARDIAPMVPAADAIQLDSTKLTLDEVVAAMEAEVRGRQAPPPHPQPLSPGGARGDLSVSPPHPQPLSAGGARGDLSVSPAAPARIRRNDKPAGTDSLAKMESSWFRLWHEFLYLPYHAVFTLGFSLRMQGACNMPPTGPALLIANHQSFLDPLVVGLCARRPLVYLARKTLFKNPVFAFIIRSMNAVPIDQEGIGLDGIRTVLEQLKLGKPVLIFPEGARTYDGAMHELKPGIHLLIKRAQVPIIPVGIAGAYGAWPITRSYPIPSPLFLPTNGGDISVALGEPMESRRFAEMKRERALQELFDVIHAEQKRAEKLRRR